MGKIAQLKGSGSLHEVKIKLDQVIEAVNAGGSGVSPKDSKEVSDLVAANKTLDERVVKLEKALEQLTK